MPTEPTTVTTNKFAVAVAVIRASLKTALAAAGVVDVLDRPIHPLTERRQPVVAVLATRLQCVGGPASAREYLGTIMISGLVEGKLEEVNAKAIDLTVAIEAALAALPTDGTLMGVPENATCDLWYPPEMERAPSGCIAQLDIKMVGPLAVTITAP